MTVLASLGMRTGTESKNVAVSHVLSSLSDLSTAFSRISNSLKSKLEAENLDVLAVPVALRELNAKYSASPRFPIPSFCCKYYLLCFS